MTLRIALAVAGLLSGAGAVQAQTYTADQQSLCTNDALRLCASAIPDVDRVTACMIQKQAQLSPGCAQFFRPQTERLTPVEERKPVRKSRKAKHRD